MSDIERLIAELAVRFSQCPGMYGGEPSTPEILRTVLRMMHALEAQRDAANERVRILLATPVTPAGESPQPERAAM